MKTDRIRIEYVQNGVPFAEGDEFVVVFNGSKGKLDLKGWRLVYQDLASGEVLYTHHFHKLKGSFDPSERLCVISGEGKDRFQEQGAESKFPGPHWDLYTDHPLHLLNLSRIRIRLTDENGDVVDSVNIERSRDDVETANVIKTFIGHGRDQQWRDLKDHLQDQQKLAVIAYEIGPRAGLGIKEVLEKMLKESSFAVLVLTGEDIHTDGEAHARENVVHELGLFQGRLGFTRAIALVEAGVKEFSNILGVNQIRFQKGSIRETFGDVVATIRREFGVFK
jgi:Predicted nucleotide-binding protein containing TIR-like domain